MQFMLVVYNDPDRLGSLAEGEFDEMMRGCLTHADGLKDEGRLLESRMLAEPQTARTVRLRNGKLAMTDGPFAEAKEVLGGFNLIEAKDIDEACEIASHFPWVRTGCVEVRAVQDIDEVRRHVFSAAALAPEHAGS